MAWWTSADAAWIGAIGGSAVGVLGAVIGTSLGVLGSRGKARGFVMRLMALVIVLGGAILVGGIVAVVSGQPYHVYYPLLLGGGILFVVSVSVLPAVRQTYAAAERRKLEAEALRQS